LARHNLKSGRADRRAASRISVALIVTWVGSWLLGARHTFDLNAELSLFFTFLSIALLNTAVTWLFYLALEPFVRRFRPHILISWTRLLAGHWRDPLVGRDLLVGVAAGVLVALVPALAASALALVSPDGAPRPPQLSNVRYLLGAQHAISLLLQLVPNALQVSMVGTFAYVMLRALTGRDWIATFIAVALFSAVVMAEESDAKWAGLVLGLALSGPVLFVFLRYGLLSLASLLLVNQALNAVPLTADLSRSHAGVSAITALLIVAVAAHAFHASRAGDGLLRRFLPA
jgi:hypothetical protein